ncbi:MAG: hypothetical protein EA400_09520 [Chromatiaceae bacterium]|nr:MAG: hypothetical protein EA400_09520 [Chromatiaceae bacterium]
MSDHSYPPGAYAGGYPGQQAGLYPSMNPGMNPGADPSAASGFTTGGAVGGPYQGAGYAGAPPPHPQTAPQYAGQMPRQMAGAGTMSYPPPLQPAMPMAQQPSQPLFNLGNERFVKGLLIGAAAAYVLSNESVQRSLIKGAVRLWTGLQGGLEEVKERFQDAEAELQAAEASRDD